jgi:hypothetical protein
MTGDLFQFGLGNETGVDIVLLDEPADGHRYLDHCPRKQVGSDVATARRKLIPTD